MARLARVTRTFAHGPRTYTRGITLEAAEFGDRLSQYEEDGLIVVDPEPEPESTQSDPPMTHDASPSLTGLGLSEEDLETLRKAGYIGRVELALATDEQLLELKGIGPVKVEKVREWLSGD
ncbi:hypothetical protein EON81_13435 [bacterium]|nr:MAG: hypothetical protein EON81_13435 [bacterium]